jgi:hypothetical protein
MAIRLAVATMGVAVFAFFTSPLIAMFLFCTFIGVPVFWRAHVEHKNSECGRLAAPGNDSEIN